MDGRSSLVQDIGGGRCDCIGLCGHGSVGRGVSFGVSMDRLSAPLASVKHARNGEAFGRRHGQVHSTTFKIEWGVARN